MTWEEDLQTTSEEGDGGWGDKSDDDSSGAHDTDNDKETEDEDGYEIGDDDLKSDDGLEEDLN
ncbi:MAG: hypothetical protein HZA25_00805 [Candidatus Niyogibacteria bacterium]|nr:hypothetical protein [Candidatus Niyogibacteria bacterium]